MATPIAFELAYDAIQAYVANRFPDDSDAWDGKVPSTDWGFTREGWRLAATKIVSKFNALLPNSTMVSVPPGAKDNHLDKKLIEFQRYLAALADRRASARVLEKLSA